MLEIMLSKGLLIAEMGLVLAILLNMLLEDSIKKFIVSIKKMYSDVYGVKKIVEMPRGGIYIETLDEKVARKRKEFEQFREYIENCKEEEEIVDECNKRDKDDLSLINRITKDDIKINARELHAKYGCNVDYQNILFHNIRNPFPNI